MLSLKGNIINYDGTYSGEIFFNRRINKVVRSKSNQEDDYIIPGFIDLHCHGANGFDTMDGWEYIQKMSIYHLKNGTTSILPTTWTSTFDHTFNALKEFKNYKNISTNILGVHLEGPFINPNKLGAQPRLAINPSIEFIKKLLDVAPIKVITLAPELEGMDDFITQNDYRKVGIIVDPYTGNSLFSSVSDITKTSKPLPKGG